MLLVMAMRAGAARTLPIDRRRDRRAERRLSPLGAQRSTPLRAGVQVGAGAVTFLLAYAVLQLMHAAGRDLRIVVKIVAIPLFARCLASAACALPVGLVAGFVARDRGRWLERLPAVLVAAIALFIVTIVWFS
jgi:hypothetical protein